MAKTISFSFLFILSSTELKETLLSALWFLLHKIGLKGVTSCQFCARSGSDHCLGLYTDLRMSHFSSGSCYSVQFSCSVVSDFLQPHGLQHARPPCPSPTPCWSLYFLSKDLNSIINHLKYLIIHRIQLEKYNIKSKVAD